MTEQSRLPRSPALPPAPTRTEPSTSRALANQVAAIADEMVKPEAEREEVRRHENRALAIHPIGTTYHNETACLRANR